MLKIRKTSARIMPVEANIDMPTNMLLGIFKSTLILIV